MGTQKFGVCVCKYRKHEDPSENFMFLIKINQVIVVASFI